MSETSTEPTFTGTPDQWWEKAEPITEAEAADRRLGDWYIGREASSYRVSTSTLSTNESRKIVLRQRIARGETTAESISAKIRKLIHIEVEPPEWLSAELVIADDLELGSTKRVAWRKANYRWQLLSDARVAVNEHSMALLNPKIAVITELS